MDKKPIIGITGSVLYEKTPGLFTGYERLYTNTDYVQAVTEAGGIPVMLPLADDAEIIKAYADTVDGLVLMGGYDVHPQYFNEEPLDCLGELMPKRDMFELALIRCMYERKKTIFGICRGMQILNVFFSGSLYQDISLIKRDVRIQHNQKARPECRTHGITTAADSVIKHIFGEKETVNSFHHMAVKEVGNNLRATAWAPDGIIEAIEHTGDVFIMGVQFHPEMTAKVHPPSQFLFNEFVRQCKS